jgi:hypothetical protein
MLTLLIKPVVQSRISPALAKNFAIKKFNPLFFEKHLNIISETSDKS